MRCGSLSLVGISGAACGIYPWRCKRWGCPHCGPLKRRVILARIRLGMAGDGPVRFMTITSPGDEDAATSYREFPKRWKRFHQRIIRACGPFEYLGVVEAQPRRGAAHFHLLYRGSYIPQRWLSGAAAASGFGRIVDIRRARGDLGRYLAKYLTKQTAEQAQAMPRHFRLVRWSHGWSDWSRPIPEHQWQSWLFADGVPLHVAQSAEARGYRVLEVVAGQLTDFEGWRIVRWFRRFEDRYRHGPPVHVPVPSRSDP